MQVTRRVFTSGLVATTLAGCIGGGGARVVGQSIAEPGMTPVPDAGYDAWVAGFKSRAAAKGIPQSTIDSAFRAAGFLPGVIERDRNQTEFKRSLEDYLSIAASDERLSTGAQAVRQYGSVLSAVEARYGVEGNVVAAVWGLESFFGTRRGSIPIVAALSTLAYEGRRGAFFEEQLIAALRILQNGDTTPGNMVGSWAGAMGHTQFIPTSYLSLAVDFNGDGRRDIWSDDPTDSLASTANYLAQSGWTRGLPWGVEVIVPAGYSGPSGRGNGRSAADWAALGIQAASGSLPSGASSLIQPAGASGPGFLITRNFNAILRYNNAENYAIGVGHLSDRLRGGGPIRGSFPPDEFGLTKVQRQSLQQRLTAAGFDTGGTDGVIGNKTKAAISAYQAARGIAVTGLPSPDLLRALGG
ncbi:MAG: lytic murein transglycosylase [Rhodobacteraceae bacterium]|jgi:lytic murein transglycosylase|nr:lytic murein transglycosylase [Paracoccaceae bacterium]